MDEYKRGLDKFEKKGGRIEGAGMLVMMNMTEGGDSSPAPWSRSQAGT